MYWHNISHEYACKYMCLWVKHNKFASLSRQTTMMGRGFVENKNSNQFTHRMVVQGIAKS